MKLLYGTTNQAKLTSMQRVTKKIGIEIFGLNDLYKIPEFKNIQLPDADETGKNPLENAIIKAKAYYKVLQIPLFSCDSGLYFENVDEKDQPGTHIRRVNGKTLTDLEALEYYSNLATSYGGKIKAKYKNAICLIIDVGRAGIIDKWNDIALCYRSLRDNTTGIYGKGKYKFDENLFFQKLKIKPDWEKINYYILLDELF